MSVSLLFDDDTSILFNEEDDAVYHIKRQGSAGVVELVENDDEGVPTDNVVYSREELNDVVQESKDAEAAQAQTDEEDDE